MTEQRPPDDERLEAHRQAAQKRLELVREANEQHGRPKLGGLRRAVRARPERRVYGRPPGDLGRKPAIALLVLFVVVLVALLVLVEKADGASREARARVAVCSVFGPRCSTAMRVVRCETGGTFSRWARGDAGERGIFQIHPVHFGWLDERRLYELRYNAIAAYRLSRGGRDWSHWTCQP